MDSNHTMEKKITFEDLSKEELVKKCKTFLTIVQKAKHSKCLLQEEIQQLKVKLESVENKEVPPAVDELIQDLTTQKLNFVVEMEDLKLKNESLVVNLNQYKEEKKRLDTELNRIDSENVSYKRQVTRLTDENEQLINHLESLEKQIEELNRIGLDQQKQLLELENRNQNSTVQQEKIQELEKMLSISLEEIKRIKKEVESDEMVPKEENLEESNKVVQMNDKLKEKLKNYHSKIVKLANIIKQLKEDKKVILDQFKLYTDQVRDWEDKLNLASKKLLIFVKNCEEENETLKQNNQHLKDLNARFMEQLEAHKTDDEKSKELEEMDTLKMKNFKLIDELNKLKENLHQVCCENEKINDENTKLKTQIEDLKLEGNNASKGFVDEKQELQQKIHKFLLDKEKCDDDNEKILELHNREIEHFKNEEVLLNERIDCLQQSENVQKQRVIQLEEIIRNLNNELEKSLATEKQLAEKSSEEMLKLVGEIEILTENSTKLQHEIDEFKQKEIQHKYRIIDADMQTDEYIPKDVKEEILLLRSENSQLLVEMNEMNQELKERGENLSKLQAHCDEIKKKIQIYEAQANKNINNISEKEETIKVLQAEIETLKTGNNKVDLQEKDQEISELKNEIEYLKEKINSNDFSSYAESDIMSTSTISRTEEIERLKDLEGSWEEKYSKLRNLAIKLKAKLRDQTTELGKEKTEKAEMQQKFNKNFDILKALQCDYDQISEELEETKKNCLEYVEKLEMNEKLFNVKDNQLTQLKIEIDTSRKDKANTDTWKKQISTKVQALRKELQEKDLKLSKLNAEIEAKEQALKLEIENHRQTKNSLQHSTNENKKNTVLNLEMQDYEKSVKDLSQKLERKSDQIIKLKGQVESQKGSIASLREQNAVLEEKIRVHENDLETISIEASAYKKKNSDIENTLQMKEDEILGLNQQLESVRSQNEELSTELSKDIAERQKTINNLREEKESLYLQNFNLQQSSKELQQKLSLKEEELVTISNEYENYKIRALSVLRQNQSRDIGLEEKLTGNVTNLTTQIEVLNSEMKELRSLNETLQKENDNFKAERSTLISKYDEISSEINEVKSQYDQLQEKYNQAINEHNETVRSLKIHAETLGQCYRQQLSEQEVRHNREIVELQSKLEKAPSPIEGVLQTLPTMPREEGEGSESTEGINRLPIPLEKLLSDGEDQNISILKRQINEQESKLTHLTELLADTEQDLAKHVQMNKVLKEEIRRQQRAVEREKHAENLEYLKNVIFKFITSNNGDERNRLVPVLNTILKLSPEETKKLNLVAKGDPSHKAWSSYLGMWSSPSNK